MSIKKAVIPAAGLGTRFLPATKAVPKELLPIVDIPVIQLIVEEAVASGVEDIIFVTGRGKNTILDHFDSAPELEQKLVELGKENLAKKLSKICSIAKIVCVRQQEPRGLGDAVLSAKELIGDEPFLVMLGDDLVDSARPCARQLVDVYKEHQKSVVALMRVPEEEVPLFGVCGGNTVSERTYDLDTMIEKPSVQDAPSNLGIVGRYVLQPSIFKYLEKTEPGKDGEIQLTDAMARMMKVEGFIGYEFTGDHYDAGDTFGFLQANLAYALKRRDIAPRLRSYLRDIVQRHG